MVKPVILFEDNHILVAVKPAGILSQADKTGKPDMLTLLKDYIREKYGKPGNIYLGLVHRLDRPVSGIMVFARTGKSASRISEQIRAGRMVKRYRAVVDGNLSYETGKMTHWISKDESKNQVTVSADEPADLSHNAKRADLSFKRIACGYYREDRNFPLSLVEIDLLTGRSHQIRAQMSFAGFPLLGDRKYGRQHCDYRGDICLESFYLSFMHPVKRERMEFFLPLGDREPWSFCKKS